MSIDMVQKYFLETDTLEILQKNLETMLPLLFKTPDKFPNPEGARKHHQLYVSKKSDSIDSMHGFLVCRIGDHKSEVRRGDATFKEGDYAGAVQCVTDIVKMADTVAFFKKYSEGYNTGFNQFDGSIDVGYRLVHTREVRNALEIYLCHMYYGK